MEKSLAAPYARSPAVESPVLGILLMLCLFGLIVGFFFWLDWLTDTNHPERLEDFTKRWLR